MTDARPPIVSDFAYCPRCAGPLKRRIVKAGEPKRLQCGACGFIFYENPKVAAGTICRIDGRVVLLKRGIEPGYGKWVFPGGFIDRGEAVEAGAVRETKEEVNLDVRIERLLNVYSVADHPIVVIVYTAEVLGGELKACDEALDVGLFSPDEIPWDALAFPSTQSALGHYIERIASRSEQTP